MTQPVWPDQPLISRAASFSGRCGSPALPKMRFDEIEIGNE
jgi:hypothetical protein